MPLRGYSSAGAGGAGKSLSRLSLFERLEPRTLFAAADLDPGFSGDGKAVVDYVASGDDGASAVVVMADGRMLVAAPRTVSRYLPDGRPDTSFAQGGKLRLADVGYDGRVGGLAVFSDGSFVAGGTRYVTNPTNPNLAPIPYRTAMKFTPTGAPDPAWRGFGA